jgi:hypothetical protein
MAHKELDEAGKVLRYPLRLAFEVRNPGQTRVATRFRSYDRQCTQTIGKGNPSVIVARPWLIAIRPVRAI